MKDKATRRVDTQSLEDLGMSHGKFDHLTNPLDGFRKPPDFLVGDL
jgi:hypothetical protein